MSLMPAAADRAAVKTIAWVVKRALLGLALIALISGTGAVLMSAGLDPTQMSESE